MQMNVLRTKQVSHVGNRDDHGQPIAGGDGHRCRRRVGSRQTGIQEPSCADIWTPGRKLWTEPANPVDPVKCSSALWCVNGPLVMCLLQWLIHDWLTDKVSDTDVSYWQASSLAVPDLHVHAPHHVAFFLSLDHSSAFVLSFYDKKNSTMWIFII